MTTTMEAPTELTNSSINTYMTCPRKYYLAYIERLKPEVPADYFRLGGAYHLAQELRGQGKSIKECSLAIAENYANPPESVLADEDRIRKWNYEGVTAICLFQGFCKHGITRTDETVETEMLFRVPIRNPETEHSTPRYVRRGKIDNVIKLEGGRYGIREYKTSSEDVTEGSDYQWKLKIDPQPSGYFVAAEESLDIQIHAIVYDVARKPTIRPSQVPEVDAEGVKIVLDEDGNRVRTKDDKKWRESGDAKAGYTLQTRPMTLPEWHEKLTTDIDNRPEFYYRRFEITRTQGDILEYKSELWSQQKQIAEAELKNRWFKNTNACKARGTCLYFNVCTQRLPLDPIPAGFVRGDVTHDELDG